jgi:hypothetical protein
MFARRTLYAALNDHIRGILRSHKFEKRLDERQDFALWLTSLLTGTRMLHNASYSSPEEADFPPDFAFYLSGETITAHRFLLAARSPYFCANLATRWRGKSFTRVRGRINNDIFRACIRWFYTGRADDTVAEDLYPEWIKVCKQLGLEELKAQVETLHGLAEERAAAERENPGRKQFRLKLGDRGLTGKVEMIMGELGWLAGCLLSASERGADAVDELSKRVETTEVDAKAISHAGVRELKRQIDALRSGWTPVTDPLSPTPPPTWTPLIDLVVCAARPDTLISVGHAVLLSHSGILRSRSPYFSAMLSGGFSESSLPISDGIRRITLHDPSDPAVAQSVLHFLYSDSLWVPTPAPSIHELLPAPCLLLLTRMTSLIASYILHPSREKSWSLRDILRLLESAEQLGVGRVESWATARVGGELEKFVLEGEQGNSESGEEEEETLREMLVRMIAESAEWVREREAEDSVPVGFCRPFRDHCFLSNHSHLLSSSWTTCGIISAAVSGSTRTQAPISPSLVPWSWKTTRNCITALSPSWTRYGRNSEFRSSMCTRKRRSLRV